VSQTPYTPSQLGVRPAPALVQQLLIGAFGWMFAGLLLSAGVAYLVATSPSLLSTVAQWWLPIVIGQFVLVIVISAAINRLSPTASLGLFFIYAATMGLTWRHRGQFTREPDGVTAVATAFLSASAMSPRRRSTAASLARPDGHQRILFMASSACSSR
jgi:FtsH-binding integral membrane protein